MSQKRDEMAIAATKEKGNLCVEHIIEKYYKQGWDAAIQNDERVLALVEALERYEKSLDGKHYMTITDGITTDTEEIAPNFYAKLALALLDDVMKESE